MWEFIVRQLDSIPTEESPNVILIWGLIAGNIIVLSLLALVIKNFYTTFTKDLKEITQKVYALDDAVNNVGPEGKSLTKRMDEVIDRLRSLESDQRVFNKTWGSLPTDLGNAGEITSTFRHLQNEDLVLHNKIKILADWIGRIDSKMESDNYAYKAVLAKSTRSSHQDFSTDPGPDSSSWG